MSSAIASRQPPPSAGPIRGNPFAARLGALAQILLAGIVSIVSAIAGSNELGFVPRPLVLFLIFGLPGTVALVAIRSQRGSVVLAAAIAAMLGAGISFSGVTLMFVIPAVLMVVGAMVMFDAERERAESWVVGAGRFLLCLALLLGAGWSALVITDQRCWTWHDTPGGVVMEPAPVPTGEMTVPDDSSGYGCSTGTISARGVGLATLLGSGAIALAWSADRRRRT